ncbi:Uncharacterized protein Fot_41995 [Forsythia ovata]|uniref:Uncharacterized protein n=1 Tax=Forsythia ovata TaxID=205694 RepID=A0ABD1RJX2_9LAMI
MSKLSNHLQMATAIVDSFWTNCWATYYAKLSTEVKLITANVLAAQSMVLIKEAEGSINKSKKELRNVTEERDKLKKDLQNTESDVAEILKRYDNATQAQLVTSKALEEVNDQKMGLIEKVAELEITMDSLKAEISGLKEEKLRLERSTEVAVKAGVENFRNQFEFTQDY